jgi:hypothetical protein
VNPSFLFPQQAVDIQLICGADKNFPPAMIGTVNFKAKPAVSRDPACVLSYSSLEMFEAS